MKKITITKGGLINILLLGLILILLFVPDAKAGVINGLMRIGFFKPDTVITSTSPINAEVKFQNGQGEIISLSDLKNRVVFINFWATWCPPCRAEMPSVNKLYNQFANDKSIVFITVDADGNFAKAKKFLDKKKYVLPLYTVASEIPANLFSGQLPTTVVLNKKGEIVFKHEGMADYSDPKFATFIKNLSTE